MDSLDQLRRFAVFAEVAAAGSYSDAARTLGISRSAVSQQIQALESDLAVRLLNRTTRSVAMTEAGRALYPHCREVVDAADAALELARVHSGTPIGELVVSAPKGLATHVVAPVIPALLAAHPGIRLDLRVEERLVDLVTDGVDVAIRAGHLGDASLTARKLGSLELVVCASPGYLDVHGRPRRPEELHRHSWLAYAPLGNRLQLGTTSLTLSPRARIGDGEVLRRLLVAGAGLGLLPRFYIGSDLGGDRLEVVLPAHAVPAGGIWAVHAFARSAPPKVRAFIDFLVAD